MHLCASRKLEIHGQLLQLHSQSQWLAALAVSEAKVLRTNREARTAVAASEADATAGADRRVVTMHQTQLSAPMPS